MTQLPPVLGVVASAADGLERLGESLVGPALARGWRVAVTLTPTAAHWLHDTGRIGLLEAATGLPVRWQPRLPRQPRPHPDADCFVVVPATANTVAKLALGLADNQALTVLCEALGAAVPLVVCPKVNAAHAGHPAWAGHVAVLRRAGVRLVYGRADADPPWAAILEEVAKVLGKGQP
jgi:hypothetical protein